MSSRRCLEHDSYGKRTRKLNVEDYNEYVIINERLQTFLLQEYVVTDTGWGMPCQQPSGQIRMKG